MKKILISLLVLVLSSFLMNAQNVITGKVVDKDGIPIPGARVTVKDGMASALSEFDGSYRLETDERVKYIQVDYVGYNSRSVMVFSPVCDVTLQKANIWNREPEKLNFVVSLQSAFPESFEQPSFGLMVSCVKNFGGYLKAMGGFMPGQSASSGDTNMTLRSPLTVVTGGFIQRLGCALHLTFGGGFMKRDVTLTTSTPSGSTTEVLDAYTFSGETIEVGALILLGNFSINAGTMLSVSSKELYMIGNFGLGVCF